MLGYLTVLLLCQLAGEVLARLTGLPLPGPVAGMLLLFAALALRGRMPEGLDSAARGLLGHLSLLFVPAGAGVVLYLPLVAQEWLPISAALIGGTLITIIVTGLVLNKLSRNVEGL